MKEGGLYSTAETLARFGSLAIRMSRAPVRHQQPLPETFPCGECGETVTARQFHPFERCAEVKP